MSLSSKCKAIILGSLLGDGSLKIYPRYKNARFSFRHSIKQKEYFDWKVNQLKEISSRKFVWLQGKDKNDGWGSQKLRYQSMALAELTDVYKKTSRQGKLDIKRKWLNKMTPLSLAIWWLDDGSLITNSRRGVFCTDQFSLKEVKILANYLKKVWRVEVKVGRVNKTNRRNQYRLWIRSSEELQKFLRIIMPHIPVPSMLPKVIMLYKNKDLQQRWISEVVELSQFSQKTVKKFSEIKRMKWKDFR